MPRKTVKPIRKREAKVPANLSKDYLSSLSLKAFMQPEGEYIRPEGRDFDTMKYHFKEVEHSAAILTREEFLICLQHNIQVFQKTAWQHAEIVKYRKKLDPGAEHWAFNRISEFHLTKEARKALEDIGVKFPPGDKTFKPIK